MFLYFVDASGLLVLPDEDSGFAFIVDGAGPDVWTDEPCLFFGGQYDIHIFRSFKPRQ